MESEAGEVEAVLEYLARVAERQGGLVNPANTRAPDCPRLDRK